MARSSRPRRQVRVVSTNATRSRVDLSILDGLKPIAIYNPAVPLFEDRRRFTPVTSRRVSYTISGRPAAVRTRGMSQRLTFVAPQRVITCVRRKVRRKVLFALGGAGSRRMRRPRHSSTFKIRC